MGGLGLASFLAYPVHYQTYVDISFNSLPFSFATTQMRARARECRCVGDVDVVEAVGGGARWSQHDLECQPESFLFVIDRYGSLEKSFGSANLSFLLSASWWQTLAGRCFV